MQKKLCKKEPEEATLSIFNEPKSWQKGASVGVWVCKRAKKATHHLPPNLLLLSNLYPQPTELAILSTENTPLIFQAL